MNLRLVSYRIAAVVGSGAVALLVLEAAVRALDLAPPLIEEYGGYVADPHLPFIPEPNTVRSGRSMTDEYDYESRTNSAGFRDVEHDRAKPDGVFRILGLGDSFTWGAGATFEETYLHQLESMLNARAGDHAPVEIIKAGIGRFWPEPERILLEQYGIAYEPDLVLVGFTPNDVADTHLGRESIVLHESGFLLSREANEIGPLGLWLHNHSHILRIALKAYVDRLTAQRYRISWDQIFQEQGQHEREWQTIEHEYNRMVAIAAEAGARLVVVHIPGPGPWEERHSYPARRLERWAAANGAGFVDALAELATRTGEPLYYPKDGHATPAGYRVIAEAIYRRLTEDGLVP